MSIDASKVFALTQKYNENWITGIIDLHKIKMKPG